MPREGGCCCGGSEGNTSEGQGAICYAIPILILSIINCIFVAWGDIFGLVAGLRRRRVHNTSPESNRRRASARIRPRYLDRLTLGFYARRVVESSSRRDVETSIVREWCRP